ncbi:hypothetical protein GCK72_019274 [Caenorhabditis remanei]|uniref:Uncharacterized protein n=1 Tax=Caenorhabditis remanei TaxID=31234 RepID=A0A6A5GE57_CAERE|nr:hypothetical protein GCK72_019274 [Caenorhabditis remanei]KAF1752719.1 hypothetical protein GCK72_019274 [Caenorhabditis remanei]
MDEGLQVKFEKIFEEMSGCPDDIDSIDGFTVERIDSTASSFPESLLAPEVKTMTCISWKCNDEDDVYFYFMKNAKQTNVSSIMTTTTERSDSGSHVFLIVLLVIFGLCIIFYIASLAFWGYKKWRNNSKFDRFLRATPPERTTPQTEMEEEP